MYRVMVDIQQCEFEEAERIANSIKALLHTQFPEVYAKAYQPSIDITGAPRKRRASTDYLVSHTQDSAAQRLVFIYKRSHTNRSFIAPPANLVPGVLKRPVPFILFKTNRDQHFWAYSKNDIAGPVETAPALMQEIQKVALEVLPELDPIIVASGYLLNDGLADKSHYVKNLKYSGVPSVDFTIRQWNGDVIVYSAYKVRNLAELKEL